MSLASSSSNQRNQKHFFLFFLELAGGRTGWGESCWWGVVGWGVEGCDEPSGGSPTFHVRTTCPSCRRKSCSTLEGEKRKGRNNAGKCYLRVFETAVNDGFFGLLGAAHIFGVSPQRFLSYRSEWKTNIHSLLVLFLVSTSSWGKISASLAPLFPQLLTNFVCLLYGAVQVVYTSGVLQATILAEWWEGTEKVTLQAQQLN